MIAIALLAGSTLVWGVLEAAVSTREPHAHLPREVATGLALLATHVAAIVEYALRAPTAQPIGLAAIAIGVALRIAAIGTLGPSFVSTTIAPLRVVRRGPYRWLRHPSELGLLAAASGAAVLLASIVAGAIVACVLVPLVIARCMEEERELARPR